MISFKNVEDKCLDRLSDELCLTLLRECRGLPPECRLELRDVLANVCREYCDEGALEAAATVHSGSLLLRLFEYGRYSFVYPIPIYENADILSAVRALRDYAVYEEIPFVLCDVPREDISPLAQHFHIFSAESSDGESFTLNIRGMLSNLSSQPSQAHKRITLDALTESDIPEYARLSRDREVNKYWGYDYSVDYPDCPDGFFFDTQKEEFSRGVSLTLAARSSGKLIGETVLHADDLEGKIEIAFRLLAEHQGVGLGREILEASLILAEKLGYTRAVCRVNPDNLPSVRLLSSLMTGISPDGTVFEKLFR
jgi:RimJ/RimL family protein N-acetyltransferase